MSGKLEAVTLEGKLRPAVQSFPKSASNGCFELSADTLAALMQAGRFMAAL